MVDGNKLGDVGFQKIGTPYSEMDCQAFVEWCLRQCGCSKDLAGSNAWYREVLKNGTILTPEECVRKLGCVPKGAFLFIHAYDGKEPAKYHGDGIGNASHIGLCTIPRGEGAINSSYSRGCVCESKFKGKSISGGWNKVGLWNQVEYDYGGGDIPDPGPEPTPEPQPEPKTETAEVWSENGKPVNTRKGPGMNYGMSKAGRLPVGTVVEIISRKPQWDQIRVTVDGATWTCWMMDEFLKPVEEPEPWEPDEPMYCVTIHDLPKALAEEIANTYGGSISEERG